MSERFKQNKTKLNYTKSNQS